MSARIRQQSVMSTAGPSRTGGTALPPYEPPQFSLTSAAQRQLQLLTQKHSLKTLDKHLDEAQAAVTTAAGDINDRLSKQEATSKKRKQRADQDGENEGNDDAEKKLEELRDKVDRMTSRMEESMRKLIDGQHSAQAIKDSVESTANHARVNASTQASTQHGRTQSQRRRGVGEDVEENDEEYMDFEPTDPAAGTQAQPPAIEKFRKDLEDAKTRYQSHSLTARYAENNSYRDFRRLVHDAQHPDGETPLSHHSEWFPEGEVPAPGVTTRGGARAADDDDSDDDIAVSKATVSTKCPLTLQEFTNPLTSTLCPHSFESDAILQMINQSAARSTQGPRAERAVQCPVSGCSKMLTKGDLQKDNVLIRKIKRIQEAKRLEAEDEDDEDAPEGTARGATFIDDDEEDGADVDDIVDGPVTQVKGEPRGTGRPVASQPPGTGVVELDESSDEAEEDDNEE